MHRNYLRIDNSVILPNIFDIHKLPDDHVKDFTGRNGC